MDEMREVCPNCESPWRDGDRYCRYCGAPMTNPKFVPDRTSTVYGPRPLTRLHRCAACGFSWTTRRMVDREKHCPQCGGSAPAFLPGDSDAAKGPW